MSNVLIFRTSPSLKKTGTTGVKSRTHSPKKVKRRDLDSRLDLHWPSEMRGLRFYFKPQSQKEHAYKVQKCQKKLNLVGCTDSRNSFYSSDVIFNWCI